MHRIDHNNIADSNSFMHKHRGTLLYNDRWGLGDILLRVAVVVVDVAHHSPVFAKGVVKNKYLHPIFGWNSYFTTKGKIKNHILFKKVTRVMCVWVTIHTRNKQVYEKLWVIELLYT